MTNIILTVTAHSRGERRSNGEIGATSKETETKMSEQQQHKRCEQQEEGANEVEQYREGWNPKEKDHSKCFRANEIEVALAYHSRGERRSIWGCKSLTEKATARMSKQQGDVKNETSIINRAGWVSPK